MTISYNSTTKAPSVPLLFGLSLTIIAAVVLLRVAPNGAHIPPRPLKTRLPTVAVCQGESRGIRRVPKRSRSCVVGGRLYAVGNDLPLAVQLNLKLDRDNALDASLGKVGVSATNSTTPSLLLCNCTYFAHFKLQIYAMRLIM